MLREDSHRVVAFQAVNTKRAAVGMCVLITDGTVTDERAMCNMAAEYADDVRILTFGIGSFCNGFFLRMLAQVGRGFSDTARTPAQIVPKLVQLISTAASPIVSNITLEVHGPTNIEIHPFPIPDLFMERPLMLAGRYEGHWPSQVMVRGSLCQVGSITLASLHHYDSLLFIITTRLCLSLRLASVHHYDSPLLIITTRFSLSLRLAFASKQLNSLLFLRSFP
jgi:hypothetical protein